MNLDQAKLSFPCHYPIKVIGVDCSDFKKKILEVIYQHFNSQVRDDLIHFKHSKNQKYLSITISFHAESREHVDNIYKDLKQCQGVLCLM